MLSPSDCIGIAVSGGADSMCLLHVLLALRDELRLNLAILHVDHNLRGAQSQADAEFVRSTAEQLNLPFHVRKLELDLRRGNLEQEARRARHAFFEDLMRDGVVQKVALGHTRSDQAETVMFRLLRGAGSAGLSGIRPVTDSGIIRPLIQVTRPQVEQWLHDHHVGWREDATNLELRFDRNRIRRQLLPQLQSEWNPELSLSLARMADWALEEERYWKGEIGRLTESSVRFAEDAAVVDASRVNALAVAAARRLIRAVVEQMNDNLLAVGFHHIEAIRSLASSPRGFGRVHIPGLEVTRSFDWIRFAKPDAAQSDWDVRLTVPGVYVVPGSAGVKKPTTIVLELNHYNGVYNKGVNALDWEKTGDRIRASGSLVLRNWRPGDQYNRIEHAGPEKVKKLFQKHRIPLWERRNWPIITVGDSIVWTSRFGPASQFQVDESSQTVLSIRETGELQNQA